MLPASNNDLATPQKQLHASMNLVRVNLLVPVALRKEWKAVALGLDKTLTDLIIEAMSHQINLLKEAEKAQK